MTAPVLDERAHRTAFVALLTASLNGHVYDYGKVPGLDGNPGDIPGRYLLLDVSRRFLPSAHGVRAATRSGWRISVRGVGLTADEARWALNKASGDLDSAVVAVAGVTSTPLQHDVSDPITPDSGMFSGLTAWTYAL